MDWSLMINFLVAMLAIVNPIGIVPIWKELTSDEEKAVRKRIAFLVTGTSLVILLIFLNTGPFLLRFFSIDMPVFKIAGGILLLLTAISMVEGKATQLREEKEDGATHFELAKQRFRKVIVPMSVPMLAGPGSMTTVLLYSFRAENLMEYGSFSVVLIINFCFLFVVLAYSYKVEDRVDELFFITFTRIFGVIVAAIAIQFMVEGLGSVFPSWLDGSSAIEANKVKEK